MNATDAGNSAARQGDEDEGLEKRLIMRARSGDGHATGELLRAYQNRIHALCVRMLGRGEDAADLTQEVLVKVMTRLGTFDGRSALSTWIYRITVNECLSHLRRQKARRLTSGAGAGGAGLEGETGIESGRNEEPGAETGVQRREQVSNLLSALSGLGEEARVLLVLRDGRGLSHAQISDVLDLPIGTIKSRLYRARSELRDAMIRLDATRDDPGTDEGMDDRLRVPGDRAGRASR